MKFFDFFKGRRKDNNFAKLNLYDKVVERFKILETTYQYVLDYDKTIQLIGDQYGCQLIKYQNSKLNQNIVVSLSESNLNPHLRCYLTYSNKINSIRIRDYALYLPLNYIFRYFNIRTLESKHFNVQHTSNETVISSYLQLFDKMNKILSGKERLDHEKFHRRMHNMGIFKYSSPKETFAFVDLVRSKFNFMINKYNFEYGKCSDESQFYDRIQANFVEYISKEAKCKLVIKNDRRENDFSITYVSQEHSNDNRRHLISLFKIRNQEEFNFLNLEASNLDIQMKSIPGID